MGSGPSRRRATGIRSSAPFSTRQGLLRALAIASIVGVGTVTGFGAAGMGPLSALAGDPGDSPTELPAETRPANPDPSDGGGIPAPTGTTIPPVPTEPADEVTPTETESVPAEETQPAPTEPAEEDPNRGADDDRGSDSSDDDSRGGNGGSSDGGTRGNGSGGGSWTPPPATEKAPTPRPSTTPPTDQTPTPDPTPTTDPTTEPTQDTPSTPAPSDDPETTQPAPGEDTATTPEDPPASSPAGPETGGSEGGTRSEGEGS